MWREKQTYLYLLIILCLLSLLFVISCSPGTTSSTDLSSTQELIIELPGTNSSTILTDNQGKLLKNAQLTSSDGIISLAIDKGTTLLDEKGEPLQFIKVTIDPSIPVPPQDAEVVGQVFEIQPQGAVVNPSLKLTLTYDPSALPQGTSKNHVWIYNYAGDTWEMVRYKQVDIGANRVTTTINRFGKYSVLAPTKPIETPAPVSQQNLTSITPKQALSNGLPTLAEFGRGTCVPCKEMKPILENLAVEYQGRLNVPIVSVDEYRDLTNYYRIMAIPTQICFDSSGKEVYKHVGFWPREEIITQLKKMGIE